MVVSGLPQPNAGRHIVEICDMGLDLLDEVSRFKIRHRPNEKLMLRIGIHTGSCATGLISYCFFENDVNVESPKIYKQRFQHICHDSDGQTVED